MSRVTTIRICKERRRWPLCSVHPVGPKKNPAEAGLVCCARRACPLPRLASKPRVGGLSFDITHIIQAILEPLKAEHRKATRYDQRRFVVVGCEGMLGGVMNLWSAIIHAADTSVCGTCKRAPTLA